MEKIKAAIIGLGRIASLLEEDALREKPCTHAGAMSANEDCVLLCGCDIDEERRKLFAGKWQVPVYEDAFEMLNKHRPQILSIATHPDSHYHYCRLAARLDIPIVICEKPLANNLRDSRKIARLASHNKPVIITNHERRYSQDYAKAKSILDEEKLGKLQTVRAVLYMGKTTRLLDMLWHDGTHLADAIMFLTDAKLKHRRSWGNKLNSRSGTAWLEGELEKNFNHELVPSVRTRTLVPKVRTFGTHTNKKEDFKVRVRDVRVVRGKFIPVIIEIGAGRDHLVFEIEFSCEKGRLRIGNSIFEVWESVPSPYAEKFRSLKNTGEEFSGATGYFANMLKDAVCCLRETGHAPVSGAIDGLRVIEYLNSVKRWR